LGAADQIRGGEIMKSAHFLWALLFVMAGSVGLVTPSSATTVDYTLIGVNDGQGDTFTGTFLFDGSSVTDFNIRAAGPNTAGETFDTLISSSATELDIAYSGGSGLNLFFVNSLTTAVQPGIDPLASNSSFGNIIPFEANVCGGVEQNVGALAPNQGGFTPSTLLAALSSAIVSPAYATVGGSDCSTTPIPDTLPLLATVLGILGLFLLGRSRLMERATATRAA